MTSTTSMFEHSLDENPRVVFCHMRKTAGTSVVQALENSSCKLPRHHRNGQAWTGPRGDPEAKIIRIWDMNRSDWDDYMDARLREDRSTVVLEWGCPAFLEQLTSDPSYEVFTCLRDPYSRFCSEFFFHDNFYLRADEAKETTMTAEANPADRASDGFVEEPRAGVTASEWAKHTLYWKRDKDVPFKAAINKHNYHVRWFCGLFSEPDAELTEEHLETAKRVLRNMKGIMILGDPESYTLLRRYNYSGRLERVRVNSARKNNSLMDISREEFNALNDLDCRLFEYAKELTEQRKQEELIQFSAHNAPRTAEQDEIMKDTDIVVPLKERGVLVRAVLEALDRMYAPRRLIVVSASSEVPWVREQVASGRWSKVKTPIEVVDEDSLWLAQPLGLTRDEMEAAFNASIVARNDTADVNIAAREFGWYLQQCIKLGVGLLMPSISDTYVVWDADLFPMRRWNLCDRGPDGKPRFFTAVLQRTARVGNAYEYLRCLRASTGLEPARPAGGGTFVTHHMVFNKDLCRELLEIITKRTQDLGLCGPVDCRGRWPLAILGLSHSFPRFSEYLTYASFLEHKQRQLPADAPRLFNYIPFQAYGMGGLRMRNAERFVELLLEASELGTLDAVESDSELSSVGSCSTHESFVMETGGGFSYDAILNFASRYFERDNMPPYLQLEHVYNSTVLPPKPPQRWDYYRAYVNGDQLLPRTAHEATVARRKLLDRRSLWWSRFESIGCVFVHIPKNAGTSVERLFTMAQESPTIPVVHQSQHFTALELREDRFASFEQLFKFCVVRNPYERLVSAYLYLANGGNQTGAADQRWAAHLRGLGTFDDFVRHYFGRERPVDWAANELPTHFVPQHMFVCSEDGTMLVDAYLDLDDFTANGLKPLLRRGLPEALLAQAPAEVPHLRRSAPAKEAGVVYTQELADLVYSAYERDFSTFHFSRDSWQQRQEA